MTTDLTADLDRVSDHADDLCRFLDATPSPYHAVEEVAARLSAHGFTRLELDRPWTDPYGGNFVARSGTLVAWHAEPGRPGSARPFRIVGAHTDSPGFRIKPRPEIVNGAWRQLGVEVYGGPLLNSWLDRDLGLAGRISVRDASGGSRVVTVRDDRAVARIPQLAIHLDREIGESGLKLDRQRHLVPVWGLEWDRGSFADHLADLAGISGATVESWDVALFDLAPAARVGRHREMIASARLDNQVSCHAATRALTSTTPGSATAVVALFDHEEVGSISSSGAGGALLAQILERISAAADVTRGDHLAALAGSHAVSVDMAHATHPNYPERHEPAHPISFDGGPAVKVNAQQRYASDAESVVPFLTAAGAAGVPVQQFVSNSSMPCGSTIGPVTAAGLAIPVVDVGVPQLAMHSVRELCGTRDPFFLTEILRHYFAA